ncbi:MAG: bacillithiol biosynthesis cysteine-adding enzyme BshC [Acidobacteriaceae bacterium]
MSTECYPISMLFATTRLYRDFLAMDEVEGRSPVRGWYGSEAFAGAWMGGAATFPQQSIEHRTRLAEALRLQNAGFGAGGETLRNIEKLRNGARAVVTGQQVGLLGGPLLTLLKAATAIARAKQVTAASGVEHVPIFWLATEDHDLEEIDQIALLAKTTVETLRLPPPQRHSSAPVGDIPLGIGVGALLDQACELLGYSPVCDLLRECYGSDSTFSSGFARLMTRLFAAHGLIVLDASGREFHALGSATLRYAIEHAAELEEGLLARTAELEAEEYHAQVLVKPGASLLFLVSEIGGIKTREPLRHATDGTWKVGTGSSARSISQTELLQITSEAPERLSPNALLRPVFQDTLLPTTAYVGGPAEVAYFAQSAVLYKQILGRMTPVIPRLSATLLERSIAALMDQHEVGFPDALTSAESLAQRLGARAMPIEAKRRLASAGNALDEALGAAESYLGSLDESLGRSANVSASKMRYQMNRLRRLAASFELQREASLRKHAGAITLHLFPHGHPQERLLGGAWFLSAWENTHGANADATPGAGLIDRLVVEAANQCPGHIVIRI